MHGCWRSLNDACYVVAAQKSVMRVSHKSSLGASKWQLNLLSEVPCCSPKSMHALGSPPFPVLIFFFIWQPIPSMAAWGSLKFPLVQPAYRDLLLMGSGDLLWQPLPHWILCFLFECMWIWEVHICVAYLEISSRMQPVSCLVSDQILMRK